MASSTYFHGICKGFAVVEVLVSILILSIGIIGVMRLQMSAIQATQQSNFYSTALSLANEMANKISGNREQTRNAGINPFLKVNFQAGQNKIESSQLCFDTNCSSNQLAVADISEWLKKISNSLPNARAKICLDDAPWDSRQNSLTWNCKASGSKSSVVIKLGWAEKNKGNEDPPPLVAMPVISYMD